MQTNLFVRSQDQLSYYNRPKATGMILTYQEVIDTYGSKIIDEVDEHGTAMIVCNDEEPSRSIMFRRLRLQLTIEEVVSITGLSPSEIEAVETPYHRSDFHTIYVLCEALGLDPKQISFTPAKDEPFIRNLLDYMKSQRKAGYIEEYDSFQSRKYLNQQLIFLKLSKPTRDLLTEKIIQRLGEENDN